jgi:homogentisate 1,2-dioxygenase
MPIYHKLGKVTPKRHTQFRKADGGLYYEQLFGTIGFDGKSSLMYQIHRPTMVK